MPSVLKVLALAALALLAACTKPVIFAPDAEVEAARHVHGAPYEIVLFNVINNETGQGEHAALMINAPSQRVLFDGAGSWNHPAAPEQHDVQFGFDDRQLFRFTYFHARRTHDVLKLRLEVSPELAEAILRQARAHGPVPDAQCALAIARILRVFPEFQSLPLSHFPNVLSTRFAALPGVTVERVRSDAEPTVRQRYSP